MTILIPTSTHDFDPTEVAVPWKILHGGGQDITFATVDGQEGAADPQMLHGKGFGLLKPFLVTQKSAQQDYRDLRSDVSFQNPLSYDDINPNDFDALLLPGGHAKATIPYLASKSLHTVIAAFFKADKPVAAICHGVVAACRALDPDTGKSVLWGRKTTALLKKQELLAYHLTRRKFGDYYRTYPVTVEEEVIATLKSPDDFFHGPTPILRDSAANLNRGFTLRDGNYLSARWPGDAHRFATDFLQMVREYQAK